MILNKKYTWKYAENINHRITENIVLRFGEKHRRQIIKELTDDIQYILCLLIDEHEISDKKYSFRFVYLYCDNDYCLQIVENINSEESLTVTQYKLSELKEMTEHDKTKQ